MIDTLEALRERHGDLRGQTLVGLPLEGWDWTSARLEDTIFIGCQLGGPDVELMLFGRGARFFPGFRGLPYDPYRYSLYTWQELVKVDLDIYQHVQATGRLHPELREALARRLHDHAIEEAVLRLLARKPLKVVGIMGGHGALRTDPYYAKTLELAWQLARRGYFVTTGGGPGVMEAGNLGAWLSPHPHEALARALEVLQVAPHFRDPGFTEASVRLLDEYPTGAESLAVPTWFYGHEPTNVFATHIAKYFANSLREDGLLAMAIHGVVYAPGSAGTTQEIFQDATQNHYGTFDFYSPMVFMGVQRYTRDTMLYPLLEQVSRGRVYHDLLLVSDEVDEIVAFLESHPPIRV